MDDTTDILSDLRESAAQTYERLSQATIDTLNRAADALEAAQQAPTVTDDPREHWVNNPLISPESKVAMFEQAVRAARQAPEGDDREMLSDFLFTVYDHGTLPNALREADAILDFLQSRGFSRRGTPATVEHIADVREVAEQIVERTKDQIATHSLDCHAYHLPCFAHFVLNRISTESHTKEPKR